MDYRDRYKWNKNSFISDSLYLKMYIDTLKRFFSVEERQIIYLVSKYFTDGVEYARKSLIVANISFEGGERLVRGLDPNLPPLLFDFIVNIYNRSKSYYFHKNGEYANATQLVLAAIEANGRMIESGHFDMLLFDSISHYHNYSALLRKNGQNEEAHSITNMLSSFLITNKPNPIFSSEKYDIIIKNVSFYGLKYSNIHSILLMSIMKEIEDNEFSIGAKVEDNSLVNAIGCWIPDMVIQNADDQKLKRWLTLYINIRIEKTLLVDYDSTEFDLFLNNTPNKIMEIIRSKIVLAKINYT